MASENILSNLFDVNPELRTASEWRHILSELVVSLSSFIGLDFEPVSWYVQDDIQNSGFLFMYENVCIAINRPSKLSYDEENLLHADEEPALQFADGYGIYANHGTSTFVS